MAGCHAQSLQYTLSRKLWRALRTSSSRGPAMKFRKDGLPFVSLFTFYVVHAGKDQKRIMDPLTIIGAVAACSDIIKTIVRITTNLSKVRSRYSEGSRSVQLLAQKLSTIRAALTEIETWAEFNLASSSPGESLIVWFRVAIDGCQVVMDALDQDISPLMEDSVRSRLRQFFLDTNSSLKEHDSRLQSQISVLQLLLTAAYWSVFFLLSCVPFDLLLIHL